MSRFARLALYSPFAALAVTAAAGTAAARPSYGDGELLAPIGAQAHVCEGQATCNGGFPEGIVVVDDRVYVSGPANFGTAGKGPSVVTVLQRSNGHQQAEILLEGENTALEHALSGLATDGSGDVFALSTQLGVVRLHRHGNRYEQTPYAPPLPDLPLCAPGQSAGCQPGFVDLPPLPNEMAFDGAGNLYITDSLQATIFKVPAGGGSIAPWFSSPAFIGNLGAPLPFGTNGIKLSGDGHSLYVIETFDPADASQSHLYQVRLRAHPTAADLSLVATFGGGVAADSLAVGDSGKVYVSLAGSSQIAVLARDGHELTRLSGPSGSSIPYDNPAGLTFDDARKSLLVANHAIFGNPADFAVLRVYVDDRGADAGGGCGDD
ncbi:MAG TPA: SMP-30/gluconolactonase/LRE family protein [Kofleriaceae bacterium]|nr:SMP-30/gluconolactonase/LRE family protein [Kofleriaceae bacterium]